MFSFLRRRGREFLIAGVTAFIPMHLSGCGGEEEAPIEQKAPEPSKESLEYKIQVNTFQDLTDNSGIADFNGQKFTLTYQDSSMMEETLAWQHKVMIDGLHLTDAYFARRGEETFFEVRSSGNTRAQNLASEMQQLEQALEDTTINFKPGSTIFKHDDAKGVYNLIRWKAEQKHYSCNELTTGAQLIEDRETTKHLIGYVPKVGEAVEFFYGTVQQAIERGILTDFNESTDYVVLKEEKPTAPSTIMALDAFREKFGKKAYERALEECRDNREQSGSSGIHQDYRGGKDVDTQTFQRRGYEGEYQTSDDGLVFEDRVGSAFTTEQISTKGEWEAKATVRLEKGTVFELVFENYEDRRGEGGRFRTSERVGVQIARYNDGTIDTYFGSANCGGGNRPFDTKDDFVTVSFQKTSEGLDFYLNDEKLGSANNGCLSDSAFFVMTASGPGGTFYDVPEMQVEGTPKLTLQKVSLEYH